MTGLGGLKTCLLGWHVLGDLVQVRLIRGSISEVTPLRVNSEPTFTLRHFLEATESLGLALVDVHVVHLGSRYSKVADLVQVESLVHLLADLSLVHGQLLLVLLDAHVDAVHQHFAVDDLAVLVDLVRTFRAVVCECREVDLILHLLLVAFLCGWLWARN